MLRLAAGLVAVLIVGAGYSDPANGSAPRNPITVAGSQQIAVIDANNNGMLNEGDDCIFMAESTPNGSDLVVTGMQDSGPNQLRACTGSCFGSGFVSSDFGQVSLDTCEFASPPFVPLLAEFCSTLQSCTSESSPTVLAQPAGNGGGPVDLTAGALFRTMTGDRAGFGQVCNAGGPAVEVTGDDGVKVLRELFPLPPDDPTHLCAANVPVELQMGGMVDKTACFPVMNGVADFAFLDSPEAPFARISFNLLPACGATEGVPTTSELGLGLVLAALLVIGVRALARRRGFSEVLPLL
jgi:hypothetical protein